MKLFRNPYFQKIGKIMAVFILTILVSGASIKQMAIKSQSNLQTKYIAENTDFQVDLRLEEEVKTIDTFIKDNEEQIRFYANMFDIDYDTAINKLKEINSDPTLYNENNIGLLKDSFGNILSFNSIDRGILEFMSSLETTNPELVGYNYRPCANDAEYIEGLVQYFSSLYDNVDYKLMLSIGAAESGYYTASTMLYKNNIYGGMGSGGLIAYKISNMAYGNTLKE